MKTKNILYVLVASLFIIVPSCKNNHKNNDDIVVKNADQQLVYPIPTPFEVTQMLQKSGTPYNLSLTNDLSKVDYYNSEKAKALNLGVYGADLAYAATYNQAQETRNILATTKKLADNLNVSAALNKNIIDRMEQNIQNRDSLYKIVNDTYIKTFNILNKQGQGAVALLVISGAWIEGLYIATQLTITSNDKSILVSKIAEQKYNLDLLIPLLQQYKDGNKNIAEILKTLLGFKAIFDKIQADDDGNLIINNAIFQQISKYAAEVRTQVVEMK